MSRTMEWNLQTFGQWDDLEQVLAVVKNNYEQKGKTAAIEDNYRIMHVGLGSSLLGHKDIDNVLSISGQDFVTYKQAILEKFYDNALLRKCHRLIVPSVHIRIDNSQMGAHEINLHQNVWVNKVEMSFCGKSDNKYSKWAILLGDELDRFCQRKEMMTYFTKKLDHVII